MGKRLIILFDLDGTLIDSTDSIVDTFHHSFDVQNVTHPSDKEIISLIGYPLDVMYKELGVSEDKVWDFVATYKEQYRKIYIEKTTLLTNAKESVIKASEFATLGIVTTKTAKYSRVLMEHLELMQYFDVLIGREDVEFPKPDAQPIFKALEALAIEDKDVWMIGDTKLDLIAANNAKVNSIGVLSGYDGHDVLSKYTNIVCNDSLEAISYLNDVINIPTFNYS